MRQKFSLLWFSLICFSIGSLVFAAVTLFAAVTRRGVVAQASQAQSLDVSISPNPALAWNGYTVTFTTTVTNNSGQALNLLTFQARSSDVPSVAACDQTASNVPAGASHVFLCSTSPVTSDAHYDALAFPFSVQVTGTTNSGFETGNGVGMVQVFDPNILIRFDNDADFFVYRGVKIPVGMTITNTGDIALSNIRIGSDPKYPPPHGVDSDCGPGYEVSVADTLAAGQAIHFTCYFTVSNAITTTLYGFGVWVRGDPPVPGPTFYRGDEELVGVYVSQTGVLVDVSPKYQLVLGHSTVTWSVSVSNTGIINVQNLATTGSIPGACAQSIGTLTPGQGIHYTCSVTGVSGLISNIVTVNGTSGIGPVRWADTATALVLPRQVHIPIAMK